MKKYANQLLEFQFQVWYLDCYDTQTKKYKIFKLHSFLGLDESNYKDPLIYIVIRCLLIAFTI